MHVTAPIFGAKIMSHVANFSDTFINIYIRLDPRSVAPSTIEFAVQNIQDGRREVGAKLEDLPWQLPLRCLPLLRQASSPRGSQYLQLQHLHQGLNLPIPTPDSTHVSLMVKYLEVILVCLSHFRR